MEGTRRNPGPVEVANNPSEGRFEVREEGQLAVVDYRRSGDLIAFTHTGVPEPLRGRGIADAMAHAALEYAREHRLGVVPLCPFVAGYINRHPEYRSLVLADRG